MDSKHRFVEFTKRDDDCKISINPGHVVAIEEYRVAGYSEFCHFYLVGQSNYIRINGSYSEVKERCLY